MMGIYPDMSLRTLLVFLLVVTCLCVGVQAAAAGPQSDREQRLRERATAYWDAAQARDLSTMYRMEAAAKLGHLTAAKAKSALGTSSIVNYEHSDFDVSGDTATVVVKVTYRLPDLRAPVPMTRKDPWTFLDGDWYHGSPPAAAKDDQGASTAR
jgi:hypothetical protein